MLSQTWSSGLAVTVEAVSAPAMLSGPTSGLPNVQYTYSTGGSTSNLGHQVQYFFDWGDDTNSGWLPVGVTTASKAWTAGMLNGYIIKTRARCATDPLAVSGWSAQLTVNIEFVTVPTTPTGPNTGQTGVSYTYSTGGAFSNTGDPVEYQFDWKGDGTDLSPWGSATQSKTWTVGGTYNVKARARCVIHTTVVSGWSSALIVNIEKVTVGTPSGPATAQLNTPYSYTFSGTSNIGDPVQIRIFWGDGAVSDWLSAPGGSVTVQKSWSSAGSFQVTAMARCAIHNNVQSDFSPALVVTVNKVNQTITFGALATKTFGDPPFTVSATASSGLPVSFSILSGPATIAGNTVTITGAGTVTVRASQPGDATYNTAPDVDRSFTVNNPVPTLTGVAPNSGTRGAVALPVVLTGSNFINVVSSVTFAPAADITVTSTTVDNPTQITVTITIGAAAVVGPRNVTVTNAPPGGTSGAQTFTVN